MGNLDWRKARRSANNGACVELASAAGQILIRDSKDLLLVFAGYWHLATGDSFCYRFVSP